LFPTILKVKTETMGSVLRLNLHRQFFAEIAAELDPLLPSILDKPFKGEL